MNEDIDKQAKIIWDFMRMGQNTDKADALFLLASIDERVPLYAAELFKKGVAPLLIISGGAAHKDDLLKTQWEGTEAEHFAVIAEKQGVPEDKIIVENKATNTGENIRFVYDLLREKNISVRSFVLIQKPYMERRTYATFMKQWPDKNTDFVVTSPPIPFEGYFNEQNKKEDIINIMVGDLQRIKEYPAMGFQIEQKIPAEVWSAFEKLVAAGFTKHLIK